MRAFRILAVVAALAAPVSSPSSSADLERYAAIAFGVTPGNASASMGVAYNKETLQDAIATAMKACKKTPNAACAVKAQWKGPVCGFATYGEIWKSGRRTGFYYTQHYTPELAMEYCKGGAVDCRPPEGGCNGPKPLAQQ